MQERIHRHIFIVEYIKYSVCCQIKSKAISQAVVHFIIISIFTFDFFYFNRYVKNSELPNEPVRGNKENYFRVI